MLLGLLGFSWPPGLHDLDLTSTIACKVDQGAPGSSLAELAAGPAIPGRVRGTGKHLNPSI